MLGGYNYIQQDYPGYQYSPVKFLQSKVVGSKQVVNFDFAKQNARGVLITAIQCTSIATPVFENPANITDDRGNTLLSFFNTGAYNTKQYFSYFIVYRVNPRIICDNAGLSFIVECQFLSFPERDNKKAKA